MESFDKILKEQADKYNILLEQEGGDPMSDVPPDPTAPTTMDASPTPEQGAEPQEPVYNKEYKDLATNTYKALRLDFEDLDPSQQKMLLATHPDEIKTDEQGVTFLEAFERVLDELDTPEELNTSEVGTGDVFGPGAS